MARSLPSIPSPSYVRQTAVVLLSIVILGSAVTAIAGPAFADEREIKRHVEGGRISVGNDAFTVVVVAEGKHPEFSWYANKNSTNIYKVRFKGIVEYLDYGQKIYQRKFNADLKEQLDNLTAAIRGLNASKLGQNVIVAGKIRENRNNATENIYNYILAKGGVEIGVNVTKSIEVKRELEGEVVVRGVVKVSGSISFIDAVEVTSLSRIEKVFKEVHPPFFEFNLGKWNFSGFQPIKSGIKTIGYQFSFLLQDVKDPKFKYLEGQIEIRSRIYNATVNEGALTVTPASLKTDLIIRSWQWNLNSTIGNLLGLDMSKDKLALWLELTAFKADREEDVEEGKAARVVTDVKSGNEKIDVRSQGEAKGEDEKELKVKENEHKLALISEGKVLGGYFNFTSYAYVYPKGSSPSESGRVNVTAAYLADGNKLRLFLTYPNFGAKSLEHDPTMGVETEGVSTVPQYNVAVGSRTAEPVAPVVTTTTTTSTSTSTTTVTRTTTSTTTTTSPTTTTATATSTVTTTTTQTASTTTTMTTVTTSTTSSTVVSTDTTLLLTIGGAAAVVAILAAALLARRGKGQTVK